MAETGARYWRHSSTTVRRREGTNGAGYVGAHVRENPPRWAVSLASHEIDLVRWPNTAVPCIDCETCFSFREMRAENNSRLGLVNRLVVGVSSPSSPLSPCYARCKEKYPGRACHWKGINRRSKRKGASFRMDEQEQAQQALVKMFRRDQVVEAVHPIRKRRGLPELPWLLAVGAVIFVLAPVAFIVIYPRFGPVDTMTAFCTAEGDGNYQSAYAMLSKRAQQRVSLAAFSQASRDANLSDCSTPHGIPIIFGGTQASLDAIFQLTGSSSGIDGSMSFAREGGAWRVDSMNLDLLHLSS